MTIPRLPSYELPKPNEFPKNKAPWTLDPSRAALLIHDMQQYFLDFYGETSHMVKDLVDQVSRVRDACRAHKIPVFYTAQPIDQSPKDRALLNDMWGAGIDNAPERRHIHPALSPASDETVLTKWRYSAFVKCDFQEQLQKLGRDQLIICGIYGHIGCLMTATHAFMLDIKPFLVGDAIGDFSQADHVMCMNYVANRCGNVISRASLEAI